MSRTVSRYVRVFARGMVEYRPDSASLGAAAYTAANVPPGHAGESWTVELREDDAPAPPPVTGPTTDAASSDWAQRLAARGEPIAGTPSWRRPDTPPVMSGGAGAPGQMQSPPLGAAEDFWASRIGLASGAPSEPPWRSISG